MLSGSGIGVRFLLLTLVILSLAFLTIVGDFEGCLATYGFDFLVGLGPGELFSVFGSYCLLREFVLLAMLDFVFENSDCFDFTDSSALLPAKQLVICLVCCADCFLLPEKISAVLFFAVVVFGLTAFFAFV